MSFRDQILAEIAALPDEKLGEIHAFVRQHAANAKQEPDAPRRLTDAEFATALKDLQTCWLEHVPANQPPLPDEAYTRASIYGDHP